MQQTRNKWQPRADTRKINKTATCLHWPTCKHDSKVIDIVDEHETSSVRENDEASLFWVRLIQTDKEIIDNRIVKDKYTRSCLSSPNEKGPENYKKEEK